MIENRKQNSIDHTGNGEKYLTIDEVAAMLQVPKGWIYQRTRDRSPSTIPFYKVGKYLRFKPDEVKEWLREQHRGWQPGQ